RTSLGEAEDVVHEEQHVLTLVAEVLCNGQTGQSNASAGPRRLVHLAVNECGRGTLAAAFLVHARFDELVVEVVAFTSTLTDASEHGVTAVRLSDVVDELLDENGLADASAAEQADLAALGVRSEQVDDLDAGDEDCRLGRLLDILRSRSVNAANFARLDRAALVDRLADDVDDAAEHLRADRNRDRTTGVAHRLAADETFGRVHSDGADDVLAEVLRNLEDEAVALVVGLERVQDRRQLAVEGDVDDSADDLVDPAGRAICRDAGGCADLRRSLLGRGRLSGLGVRRLGRLWGSCFSHSKYPLQSFLLSGLRRLSPRRTALERFRTRDDFDQFGGDLRLTLAVV